MVAPALDPKLQRTIARLEQALAEEKRQRIANARSAAQWRRAALALRRQLDAAPKPEPRAAC